MPARSTPQVPSSGLAALAEAAACAAAGLVCASTDVPATRAAQATPLSSILLIIKRNPLHSVVPGPYPVGPVLESRISTNDTPDPTGVSLSQHQAMSRTTSRRTRALPGPTIAISRA